LAIVGDAAHAVSPMTGRGYLTGVDDALALSQKPGDRTPDEQISATLARYEVTRLPFVRSLVTHSERISVHYARYAASSRTKGQIPI
jgi:2-polyprenyl-6-methoxyphenol hydroxylase-like FAD-dependent oxidoreductase